MTNKLNLGNLIRHPLFGFFTSGLGAQSLRSALIRIVNVGLSLAISILLARILGVDGLGIYAGAMALISLLAVPAMLGVPVGLIQLVSRYLASNELDHARGMMQWGVGQVLAGTLVLASAGAIIAISFFWNDITTVTVYLLAFAVLPILGLTSAQRAILNAFELSSMSITPQDIVRPGFLAAALFAWLIFWPEYRGNAAIAMSLQLLAFVIALLAGTLLIRRYGSSVLSHGPRAYDFRRWYRTSIPFMLLAASEIVMSQTDIIMLAWWEPPASAGLYRIATSAALLINLPAIAIATPLAPAVARLFQQNNTDELKRTVRLTARWAFAGCLPIALVLIFGGDWLLGFVFGHEFIAAHTAVVILVFAQIFHLAVGPVGVVLEMTGFQHFAAKVLIIGAVANVVLNAVLIPTFGIVGAAVATAISIVIWNGLTLYGVFRHLKIDPTILGRT